jgi:hypothetical protein
VLYVRQTELAAIRPGRGIGWHKALRPLIDGYVSDLFFPRFVFTAWGSSPPLYRSRPSGWTTTTFSAAQSDPLKHQDRLLDLFPFGAKLVEHLVDVHL